MNLSPDNEEFDRKTAATDSGSPGARRSVQVLCLLVLLYIPVQWVAGRRPGSTPIFSSQHRETEKQVRAMTSALRSELLRQCAQRGIHDIYFTDGDVISPYLVNDIVATPDCRMQRETVVTLFDDAPKLACSAVLVDEEIPNPWNAYSAWDYLGSLQHKLVSVSGWDSEEKQFNFRLLQERSCAHGTQVGEAPQGPAAP